MAKLEEYREPVLCLFQEHLMALVGIALIWWIWMYNPMTVDASEEEPENVELNLEQQINLNNEADAGRIDTMAPVECKVVHQIWTSNGNITTHREKSPRRQ
jgi:hypothetical protein